MIKVYRVWIDTKKCEQIVCATSTAQLFQKLAAMGYKTGYTITIGVK